MNKNWMVGKIFNANLLMSMLQCHHTNFCCILASQDKQTLEHTLYGISWICFEDEELLNMHLFQSQQYYKGLGVKKARARLDIGWLCYKCNVIIQTYKHIDTYCVQCHCGFTLLLISST